MNPDDKLPVELLWQEDGHVTDVVVDSLADGQEAVVPTPARAHVQACDVCARRLGEAALLTLHVEQHLTRALAPVGTGVAAPQASWPMPVAAIAFALFAALLATLPVLLEAPARFAGAAGTLVRITPDLVRAMLTVVQGSAGGAGAPLTVLSTAAVIVLIAVGMAVARFAPRQQTAGGGAR